MKKFSRTKRFVWGICDFFHSMGFFIYSNNECVIPETKIRFAAGTIGPDLGEEKKLRNRDLVVCPMGHLFVYVHY